MRLMKLIILYGAPAAGKLTIAQKLAEIADVKVFDNHRIIDVVQPIVPRAYDHFVELIYSLQYEVLSAAMNMPDNVVFTLGYAADAPTDPPFLQKLIDTAKSSGAEVYPYFLHCNKDDLLARVANDSRLHHGKITTQATMQSVMEKYDFDTLLPGYEHLTIETDKVSPEDAASRIKNEAGL